MSSRAFLAALAFVVLGLGASVAATWVHYQLTATPGYISFCDVNATFSCAQAYQSVYGRLFGVPVALLGAVFFGGLLLLMTLGRHLEALAGYLFAAAILALGVVLYLAWATVFVLGTLCLLCLTTYVAVLGVFFVAGAAMPFPLSGLPARLSRDLARVSSSPAAIVALLLLASTAVAGAVLFPADEAGLEPASASAGAPAVRRPAAPPLTEAQKAEIRTAFDNAPRAIVPADAPGARVVIVKFNDYQCPPCRQTYELYLPLKRTFERTAPGQVAFITRDFPLEPECNPSAPGGSHAATCESAAAVRMAREAGKVDAMEAWLFARQAQLSPALVREGVREVVGITDFDARYPSMLAAIRNDTALGASLGVTSTPTFFVNGVKMGGVAPEMLEYVIEYELSKRTGAGQ